MVNFTRNHCTDKRTMLATDDVGQHSVFHNLCTRTHLKMNHVMWKGGGVWGEGVWWISKKCRPMSACAVRAGWHGLKLFAVFHFLHLEGHVHLIIFSRIMVHNDAKTTWCYASQWCSNASNGQGRSTQRAPILVYRKALSPTKGVLGRSA